jgi:hypothetical protein
MLSAVELLYILTVMLGICPFVQSIDWGGAAAAASLPPKTRTAKAINAVSAHLFAVHDFDKQTVPQTTKFRTLIFVAPFFTGISSGTLV